MITMTPLRLAVLRHVRQGGHPQEADISGIKLKSLQRLSRARFKVKAQNELVKAGLIDGDVLDNKSWRLTADGAKICAENDPPTPEVTLDILRLVIQGLQDNAIIVVRKWNDEEREAACKWAGAIHLRASDNNVRIPPRPNQVVLLMAIYTTWPDDEVDGP
jgi:hypothetical protein